VCNEEVGEGVAIEPSAGKTSHLTIVLEGPVNAPARGRFNSERWGNYTKR